jgi:hypothetical protein
MTVGCSKLWHRPLMTLELSITLLENINSRGVTHDDHYKTIVIC